MHVEIETMEWFNILMVKILEPNYMQGGFDLRNGGGQDGAFNEPRDWKDCRLTLVLGFFSCHLFGILFGIGGGLHCSI